MGPQALFSEPSVETLHVAVLHRAARLDVAQFDLPLQPLGKEVPAGQFRPVVATDRREECLAVHSFIEHTGDTTTGKARIHFQWQALAREGVDHP